MPLDAAAGAMAPHEFLRTLAIVLMVAAATSVLFQRIKLPVIDRA